MAPFTRAIPHCGWAAGMVVFGLSIGPGAVALRAQTAEVRGALLALRDTAGSLATVQELRALRQSGPRGPAGLVRRAMLLLREAELGTGRGPFDNAVLAADRASRSASRWPTFWYVSGLIWHAMWDRRFLSKEVGLKPAGISYFRAANDAYAKALRLDPGFQPAADGLAQLLIPLEYRNLPSGDAELLEAAARHPDVSGAVLLMLGRLAMLDADYPRVLAADERCLSLGCDSGLAALDQARALRALGREGEAVAAYWRGLRAPSPAARSAYRNDAALVAEPAELDVLDTIPPEHFARFLEEFWNGRAVRDLRSVDARLSEHLRRWVEAHRAYLTNLPPESFRGVMCMGRGAALESAPGSIDPLRFNNYQSAQVELDDRGVVYVRLGEPVARAFSPSASRWNESWAYDLGGKRLILHFVACDKTASPYKLVPVLPFEPELWESRSGLDPRYSDMANRITLETIPPERLLQWDHEGREAIRLGTRTDDDKPRFSKVLAPAVQIVAVGLAPGEAPRALIAFAVPIGGLQDDSIMADGRRLYRLRFTFFARDLVGGGMRQVDTLRQFLVRAAPGRNEYLQGSWEVPLRPSTYEASLLVSDSLRDAGGAAHRDSMIVPVAGGGLASSDLLVGDLASGLEWSYRGGRVPLSPLGTFRRGDTLNVFQELSGLTPGRRYQVAIELRRAGASPKRPPVVRLGFEAEARDSFEVVKRSLGLEAISKGAYSLGVTVRDPVTGDSTVRRFPITVTESP